MATFRPTPHPEPKQKPTEWPNLGRVVWYDPLKTRYGYPEAKEFRQHPVTAWRVVGENADAITITAVTVSPGEAFAPTRRLRKISNHDFIGYYPTRQAALGARRQSLQETIRKQRTSLKRDARALAKDRAKLEQAERRHAARLKELRR